MTKYFTWCLSTTQRTMLLINRLNASQQPVPLLYVNNFALQIRHIANPQEHQINIDYDEPKDYKEFVNEIKHNRTQVITTLIKILSVARANAKQAIKDYPKFTLLPQKTIYMNFQLLREEGFYKSTIKDNKYLLLDTTAALKQKISIVQKFGIDINDAAPLFHLSILELVNFEKRMQMESSYFPASNRLLYLAEKLQCDIFKICNVMSYNPLILKLPAPKLLSVTEYLLESGVAPMHILNDMQVYFYSIRTIKDKIERAKEFGVKPLKPWILRCQDHTWKIAEERKNERESILKPGQTISEWLCETFDCDMESVNFLMSKYKKIRNMNLEKLTSMTKFLRNEGYRIEDIQRTPSVLYRNYSSLVERFSKWKKLSNLQPPLFIFTLSQEKFELLLKARCSSNENKKQS